MGQILDVAFADFLDVATVRLPHGELAVHIAASRVGQAGAFLIVRPFSFKFLAYGQVFGPHFLFGVMRGKLPKESALKRAKDMSVLREKLRKEDA